MDDLTKTSRRVADAIVEAISWHAGNPPPRKWNSDAGIKRELEQALDAFARAVANETLSP